MKSQIFKALLPVISISALLAAGCVCVNHEVKSTAYVPPTPVTVAPPPTVVVTTPPPSNPGPDISSTSQTTETYNSTSSDSVSEPGGGSTSTSYRQHSESSTVKISAACSPFDHHHLPGNHS